MRPGSPSEGPPGGPPGEPPGGPPGGQGPLPPIIPAGIAPPLAVRDVKPMGKLPVVFDGN